MAWAISSFPVPVSPRTRTVESVGATRSTFARTAFNAGLSPTICSMLRSEPFCANDFLAFSMQTSTRVLYPRPDNFGGIWGCTILPMRESLELCCVVAALCYRGPNRLKQLFVGEGFAEECNSARLHRLPARC